MEDTPYKGTPDGGQYEGNSPSAKSKSNGDGAGDAGRSGHRHFSRGGHGSFRRDGGERHFSRRDRSPDGSFRHERRGDASGGYGDRDGQRGERFSGRRSSPDGKFGRRDYGDRWHSREDGENSFRRERREEYGSHERRPYGERSGERREYAGRDGERRFSREDSGFSRHDRPDYGSRRPGRGGFRDGRSEGRFSRSSGERFRKDRPSFDSHSREDRSGDRFTPREGRRYSRDDGDGFRSERGYARDGRSGDLAPAHEGRRYSRDGGDGFHKDRPSFGGHSRDERSGDRFEPREGRRYSREGGEGFRKDRPSFDNHSRDERSGDRFTLREGRRYSRDDGSGERAPAHEGRRYSREGGSSYLTGAGASEESPSEGRRFFRDDGESARPERPAPRPERSPAPFRGGSGAAPSDGAAQRRPLAKRWVVDEKAEQEFLSENQYDGRDGYDVIIMGAGASGLSCALRCTELGLSVCVIDRERTPARKLAISGGGYANFTNSTLTPDCYLCGTPDFVPPVLDAFCTMGMTRFMDSLGLPWEKREGGRYFLKTRARDLVSALIRGCRKGRFTLRTGLNVPAEGMDISDSGIAMTAKDGTQIKGRHLVLALGSPACPAVGASGYGYALAQQLGHRVITPEAALTPFLLPENSPLFGLQGVSLPVDLTTGGEAKRSFRDDLLFTHEGLSGPAALKASLFWHREEPITIDFFAGKDPGPIFSDEACGRGTPRSILSRLMPQSLVDSLVPEDMLDRRCAEIGKAKREELLQSLRQFTFVPSGTAGLRHAEVCRGGVDTSEVVPMTFFSRLVPRLSIIGELLDVTGLLGGYNLHWAMASGRLAATALYTKLH